MLPPEAQRYLKSASMKTSSKAFQCQVFNSDWDQFVVDWAPRIYSFLVEALGPFGTEPQPRILKLPDGMHMSGATASFDMVSGQISLCSSVEGNPGQTLEKLTHEMVHGSLSQFPSVEPFYDEGEVDYATWVLAHAPIYEPYRQKMIDAAAFNIKMRRERAFTTGSDYDKKRWAGGVYAMMAYGPLTLARLRNKKAEGDFNW
jgi:hypothetical protein